MTAPKGRPTPPRDALEPRRFDTVTLEWVVVGLIVAGIIAVAAYFARDQQPSNIHGGGGNSSGVVVDEPVVDLLDSAA